MKRLFISALGLPRRTKPNWNLSSGSYMSSPRLNSSRSAEEHHDDYLLRVGEKMQRMTETNLMPEALSLVDRLTVHGYDEEAEETINFMRDEGIPEVVTCIEKIRNLCERFLFEEAKLILSEMKKFGPGCSEHAHLVLVEGLINGGELEHAMTFFREMNNNGTISSSYAYDFTILEMCKENSVDYVVNLGSQMLEDGHIPRLGTIAKMFYFLCKNQKLKEARELVMKMKEKGAFYFDKIQMQREFVTEDATTELVMDIIFGKNT